jgi:hypothetical protein
MELTIDYALGSDGTRIAVMPEAMLTSLVAVMSRGSKFKGPVHVGLSAAQVMREAEHYQPTVAHVTEKPWQVRLTGTTADGFDDIATDEDWLTRLRLYRQVLDEMITAAEEMQEELAEDEPEGYSSSEDPEDDFGGPSSDTRGREGDDH